MESSKFIQSSSKITSSQKSQRHQLGAEPRFIEAEGKKPRLPKLDRAQDQGQLITDRPVSAVAGKQPAWMQLRPKMLSERKEKVISQLTNEFVKNIVRLASQPYNMIVPPTIEALLRIMTIGLKPDFRDSIAVEAYNQEVSEMSNSIAKAIVYKASIVMRTVADLTAVAIKPTSALVTTVVTAAGKNLFPIYKSAYFLLCELIFDEMLVQCLGNQASRMSIEVTAYVMTEQWWLETGGSDRPNIDISLLAGNILEVPMYNVFMDAEIVGGYEFFTATLIKLAVQASINKIAKLPIGKAINIVMKNLKNLIRNQQDSVV